MIGDRRYERTEEEKAICMKGCPHVKTCKRNGILGYNEEHLKCTVNMGYIEMPITEGDIQYLAKLKETMKEYEQKAQVAETEWDRQVARNYAKSYVQPIAKLEEKINSRLNK